MEKGNFLDGFCDWGFWQGGQPLNDDDVDEDGFCETKKTTFEAQAPPASWKAASAVSA